MKKIQQQAVDKQNNLIGKSYWWLLREMAGKKVPVGILETGICRSHRLLDWFDKDYDMSVKRRKVRNVRSTKDILNFFQQKRSFQQHNAEGAICFILLRDGQRRLVNRQEVKALIDHQLHGMQVRMICLLPKVGITPEAFLLKLRRKGDMLSSHFFKGPFTNPMQAKAKNTHGREQALRIAKLIVDFIEKHTKLNIVKVDIEIVFDQQGKAYCLNIPRICLIPSPLSPTASHLKKNFTIIKNDDSGSELSENEHLENGRNSRRIRSNAGISDHFLEIVNSEMQKYALEKERLKLKTPDFTPLSPKSLYQGFTAISNNRLNAYYDSNRTSRNYTDFSPPFTSLGFYYSPDILIDRPISQRFSNSSRRALANYKSVNRLRIRSPQSPGYQERKLFNLILQEEKRVLQSKYDPWGKGVQQYSINVHFKSSQS